MEPQRNSKKIIGVPIIPGIASSPTAQSVTVTYEGNGQPEAASSVDHQPSSPALPRASDVKRGFVMPKRDSAKDRDRRGVPETKVAHRRSGSLSSHHKLAHIDFMPKQLKENDYERFSVLVDRGNKWLSENPHCQFYKCETVTWMSVERQVFTDNGILTKSMHSDKKSKIYKGLRIWYISADERFCDKLSNPHQTQISYRSYSLTGKNDSLKTLLERLNKDLQQIPGQPISCETLHFPSEVNEPDACFWREEPHKDRIYCTCLRLFLEHRSGTHSTSNVNIEFEDFVPQFTQRTVHNHGYETYTDVWKRAAKWIHQTPHTTLVNTQSVFVKFKKDASDEDTINRLVYKEHGCAHSSIHQHATEYLQIIRVVYTNNSPPTSSEYRHSSTNEGDEKRLKMDFRMFIPARIKRQSSISSDEEIAEASYEDMSQVEARLNDWLLHSGARLSGIETIPVRLKTGGQDTLGSDATFVYNNREKNITKELWRVNIRLYVEGEFRDLPAQQRKSLYERSSP